jgi:hypothetical protein
VRDGVNDQCGNAAQQNYGVKSQDRAGAVVLKSSIVLGANAWHRRGRRQATTAAPPLCTVQEEASLKRSNIAAELEMRIAAALKATAGSIGPLGGTVRRLNKIYEALKAQRASGLLTDEEYAKEAGGLLNILSNFDGLISEAASPRA